MSFVSLLRHRADVIRQVAVTDGFGDPTYDERGQPITTSATIVPAWPCRIEPRSAREVAQLSQAGPVVADHIVYGQPTDLRTGDRLVATDDRVFEVMVIDDAGGHGHHFEVQARRVGSDDVQLPEPS